MEINFLDYIKKYGRELKQTNWGQIPRWELGILHEKNAIRAVDKDGLVVLSIKTQPVGIVEDGSGNYIQSISGQDEYQINKIFENDVRGNISKNSKLSIGNFPVIFQELDAKIKQYKDEVYSDRMVGIETLSFDDLIESF